MANRCWTSLGILLLTTIGCTDDAPNNANAQVDAAVTPEAAVCTIPERPYGMTVGSNFPQMTLTDCTTEEAYSLYDEAEFCGPQVTVIAIAAGWCGACQVESASLERDINTRYAGRGVRFLQVMLENPDRTRGTAEFCRTWQTRYHLTNRMMVDPAGSIRRFAGGALPGALIFDNSGVIRFIGHGTSMRTIQYNIDAILDGVATTPDDGDAGTGENNLTP